MWRTRPSALLGLKDEYVAYCLDEAGAWLVTRDEPPYYGEKKTLNGNRALIEKLKAIGALKEA